MAESESSRNRFTSFERSSFSSRFVALNSLRISSSFPCISSSSDSCSASLFCNVRSASINFLPRSVFCLWSASRRSRGSRDAVEETMLRSNTSDVSRSLSESESDADDADVGIGRDDFPPLKDSSGRNSPLVSNNTLVTTVSSSTISSPRFRGELEPGEKTLLKL